MKKQLTLKKLSLFVLTALLFVLLSLAFAFTGTARAYADGDGQPCPDGQHNLGDIFVIEKQTCVSHGVGVRYCKDCGLSFNVVIPADGISHKVDKDGKCSECGAENVEYVITENLPEEDYVEVGQVQESEVTEITIPATVTTRGEEKEVHIAEGAFEGNTKLTKVTIEGTPEIGADAFKDCENLETVVMAEGTQNIAADAFVGTLFYEKKLEEAKGTTEKDELQPISIPISQKVGDEYQPTKNYYLLKVIDPTAETKPESKGRRNAANEAAESPKTFTYTVDPGTKVIAGKAFAGLANLVEVTLNPDLNTVGANAFDGCSALKTIYIAEAKGEEPTVTKDSFANVAGLAPYNTIYYRGEPQVDENKKDTIFKALANVIRYYSVAEPTDNTHTYWHMVEVDGVEHPTIWNKAVEIALDTSHCTTRFRKGEAFSSEGLVVKVRYDNETQLKELTEAQQANLEIDDGGYAANKLGTYTITVTYLTYLTATYDVTVDDAYTITINYGYEGQATKTELVFVQDGFTLPAAPEREGYKFLGWKVGTEEKLYNPDEKFTPTADTTVTAQWEKLYKVTATAPNASTNLPTNKYYESDTKVDFSVTPANGYKLVSVKNGDATLTAQDGKYSVTVGKEDIVITVETAAVTVTATATDDITPQVSYNDAHDTATITLTTPTKEGYRFDGWTAKVGSAEPADVTGNTYSLKLQHSDVTVTFTAQWTAVYTVGVTVTGGHATYDFDADDPYEEGTVVKFTLTIEKGYKLVSIKNGTADLTLGEDGKYSVTVAKANITITVTTAEIAITATATDDIEVTQSKTATAVTFTVQTPAKKGYLFKGWTVTVNGTAAQYTEQGLTVEIGNADIIVAFTAGWEINFGTKKHPLSVEEAIYLAETIEEVAKNQFTSQKVYAIGKVINQPTDKGAYLQNVTIQDLEKSSIELLIYTLNTRDGVDIPDQNDTIVVYGYIKNHNGTTLEFASKTLEDKTSEYVYTEANTRGESTITVEEESASHVTGLPQNALNGSTVHFAVTAPDGMRVESAIVNGKTIEADEEGQYSFEVHGNTTIKVTFVDASKPLEKEIAKLSFEDTSNNDSVTQYNDTKPWAAQSGGYSWNIYGFNNNSNKWNYIKTGHKDKELNAKIDTAAAIEEKITKVVVTIHSDSKDYISKAVKEFKLQISDDDTFENVTEVSATMQKGEVTFNISSPASNKYYRILIVTSIYQDPNAEELVSVSTGYLVLSSVSYIGTTQTTEPEKSVSFGTSNLLKMGAQNVPAIGLQVTTEGYDNATLMAATLEIGGKSYPAGDGSAYPEAGGKVTTYRFWIGGAYTELEAATYDVKFVLDGQEYTKPMSDVSVAENTVTYNNVKGVLAADGQKLTLTLSAEGSVEPDEKSITSVYNLTVNDQNKTLDFFANVKGLSASTMTSQNTYLVVNGTVLISLKEATDSAGTTIHFVFDLSTITGAGIGLLTIKIGEDSYPVVLDGEAGDPWSGSYTVGNYEVSITGAKGAQASMTITAKEVEPAQYSIQSVSIGQKEAEEKLLITFRTNEALKGKQATLKIGEQQTITAKADSNGTEFVFEVELSDSLNGATLTFSIEGAEMTGNLPDPAAKSTEISGKYYTLTKTAEGALQITVTTNEEEPISGTFEITIKNSQALLNANKSGVTYGMYSWNIVEGETVLMEGTLYASAKTMNSNTDPLQFSRRDSHPAYIVNSKATPAPIREISVTYSTSATKEANIPSWSLMTSTTAYVASDSSNPTKSGTTTYSTKKISVFSNNVATITWGSDELVGEDTYFALYIDSLTPNNAAHVAKITIKYGGTTGGGETTDSDLQKAQAALDGLTIDDSAVTTPSKSISLPANYGADVTFNWTLTDNGGVAELTSNTLKITQSTSAATVKLSATATYNGQTTPAKEFTIQVSAKSSGGETEVGKLYGLSQSTGSNSSYASSCEVESGNVTWKVEGNTNERDGWRFGGKGIDKTDRALTAKDAISGKVTKIVLTLTDSGSITVNSVTLKVYKSDPTVAGAQLTSTKSITYSKDTEQTIQADENEDWTNCFFQLVFNVSVSGTKNKYVAISKLEFYGYAVSSDQGMEGPKMASYTANMNNGNVESDGLWLALAVGGSALLLVSSLAVVLLLRKHN